jgi:Uma2 family endonuclease
MAALSSLLSGPFQFRNDAPSSWVFLVEPELHLVEGSKPLVPDLCGYRRENVPSLDVAYFESAPDWVCEILSPGNAARDRSKKMPLYAKARVPHAWLSIRT